MGWFKVAQVIGSKVAPTIKKFKPFTKFKGQSTVSEVQSKAAKAKLESVKFNLGRTFSKTEKSLKKLKKSVDKTKNLVKHYYPPKDFLK